MTLAQAVLALMLSIHPTSPWKSTFESTATAIADASTKTPLFAGKDGATRTAYLVVAVAEFESGFRPDAEGDCDRTDPKTKMCVKGSTPHSFCLLQISETNFAGMGTTRAEIQSNVDVCVSVGLRMMKRSFDMCRSFPLEDRLTQYASGGPACVPALMLLGAPSTIAGTKSKHRVNRALWLFREHPIAVLESSEEAHE